MYATKAKLTNMTIKIQDGRQNVIFIEFHQ